MTKDMFIPRLFDMPVRKHIDGKVVSGTASSKMVKAIVGALEETGLIVRQIEPGHFTCHVSGKELFDAKRGYGNSKNTYIIRYAQDVMKLVEKKK